VLPNGTPGSLYNQVISSLNVNCAVNGGTVPPGMEVQTFQGSPGAVCALFGYPTTPGLYQFSVRYSTTPPVTRPYQITIDNTPNLSVTPFIAARTTTTKPGVVTPVAVLTNTGAGTSFGVSITGAGFTIATDGTFIAPNETKQLRVSFDTTGRPPGVYTGTYTVTANGGSFSTKVHERSTGTTASGTAQVTINGVLLPDQTTLTFNLDGSPAPTQKVGVSEERGFPLIPMKASYSSTGGASVQVTPADGKTPAEFTVTASLGTMLPGTTSRGDLTITCTSAMPCEPLAPIRINVNAGAAPTTSQVFPHFADGGEWQTEFLLINPTAAAVTASLKFYLDAPATTLNIQGVGNVTGINNFVIPPNGSVFYRTTGVQLDDLKTGWVEVVSPTPLNGTALFRRHATDRKYYEGSIPLATPTANFTIPFDGTTFSNGAPFKTGLALANPSTSATAQVTCSAYSTAGALLGSNLALATAGPLKHPFFVLQSSAQVGNAIGTSRGILACSSTAPVGVLGLRFFGDAALSSLPVITPGTRAVTTGIFPHFADGGVEWQTEFLLINPNSTAATATLTFHPRTRTTLKVNDVGDVASIANINIPANGSAVYRTTGNPADELNQGWAEVTSTMPLNGVALFRRRSGANEYYEGSIPLGTPSAAFTIPFDGTPFSNGAPTLTGLALANPNGSTNTLTCSAYGATGALLQGNFQLASLKAQGHDSLERQNSAPAQGATSKARGILICRSSTPTGVLGLRFFGDAALSSLPVTTSNLP